VLGGRFGASEAGTCWYGEGESFRRGSSAIRRQLAVARRTAGVDFLPPSTETHPAIQVVQSVRCEDSDVSVYVCMLETLDSAIM